MQNYKRGSLPYPFCHLAHPSDVQDALHGGQMSGTEGWAHRWIQLFNSSLHQDGSQRVALLGKPSAVRWRFQRLGGRVSEGTPIALDSPEDTAAGDRAGGPRPISLLRVSLPRVVDSNFLGNSLWT